MLLLVLVGVKPAAAEATAEWLPFKVGTGVVEVGCTWNNGCEGNYHGTSGLGPSIDFIAPVGTEVYAAGAGTVVAANNSCHPTNSPGCSGGRGRFIEIAHPDGRHSRYLHLSEASVTSGDVVGGQLIGKIGNSGGSPVAHLHYDETVNGSKVDPGKMKANHGSTLVEYPDQLGTSYDSWDDVPSWSDKFVVNDSYEGGSPGNQTPPAVPWHFENLEGDPGAVSPHNSDVGRTPAAVEFNGQLYVFHFDANYGDLRYARTSPGWVFDILDGAGGTNNRTTSRVGEGASAVVFNNQLHVFYYDSGAGNLRHAVSSNGVYWTFENLDGDWGSLGGLDGNIGQTPVAIVFGTSLQVFYYDAGRGNLRHAWFSGASWYFENLEGDPGSISHYDTNIGLDPTAAVHGSTLQLFYYDVAAGNLRHTWADGSGWHFENLDGDSGSIGGLNANVGSHPSTVIYGGNLHVFYYDQTNGNFRHMWADAVGWHAENLEGDVGSVSGYNGDVGTMSTTVVVGSTLQVFVYEAGLGNLRHLLDDGTGWKWENFDGQGGSPAGRLNANVGLDPIVTTFGGGLQLFYYDYEHGDLRHAVPQ